MLFGCNNNETKQYEIFPIGCLIGIVGSAMLVTSLTAVACFIGENIGTYFYSTLIQPLIAITVVKYNIYSFKVLIFLTIFYHEK